MSKKILLPILLVVAMVALSGCFLTDKIKDKVSNEVGEKVTEKVLESATGTDIDLETNSATVNSNGNVISYGTQELPDGFPSNIPVYQPSTIVFSSSTTDGDYSVSLEVKDTYANVVAYYDTNIKSNNWTVDYSSNYNSDGTRMTMMNLSKNNELLDITITETDASTVSVGLIAGKKSE